ncbi:MAG: serine O-acetyltransferase [Anaerovibrio sp.]|uniref:Serine acetyltransferase n=1 Tax=Anaerovibrio slackiae TaxID=2652309 RepID=A0A6I2UD26_9FIRM|nr:MULTISPECIES: serine O-acetyltransferase [Anaerovibrio]MBQ2010440.1 serine O-acetyltransferase [Selenomonadaceae bacterium]MBQ2410792.1 serine O-acetyltransferase [Selenomonadaceae bacterium]MBQ5732221.1 serine O-acetyltransferase [Selenomonadaceae bacterium]MBQ5822333.1 serine O-acetyltransferase [Selenomonadaceae bacterium]MBQ5845379.1 serine O-acetyltransferase [Selenomonadaceae bacterium]
MFFKRLRSRIKKDIRVIFERDPAARSVIEVVCCYSGLHAIWLHRISHKLYLKGWVLIPRMISNLGRFLTGIEIHPGATIGEGLFIDHGTGIVIGETAELGRNVTLYQGVTLGGTGKEKGKRHPTIGNNVVVASGAKVLGSFTVGDHAKIGAGSVVLKAVPAYATVVGIPGRVVVMHGKRVGEPVYTDEMMKLLDTDIDSAEMVEEQDVDLNHDELPDPVRDLMLEMSQRLETMEKRVKELEQELQKKELEDKNA